MLPLVLLLACSTVDAPALPDEAPSIPMTVKPDASRLAIATSPDRGERVRAKVVAGTTPTEAMIQRFDQCYGRPELEERSYAPGRGGRGYGSGSGGKAQTGRSRPRSAPMPSPAAPADAGAVAGAAPPSAGNVDRRAADVAARKAAERELSQRRQVAEEAAAAPSPAAEPKKKEAAEGSAGAPLREAEADLDDVFSTERPADAKPVAPVLDWGATVYLSNDDSMSLASAQRLLYSMKRQLRPSVSEVRPHELLNYFSFDVAPIEEGRMFSVLGAAEQQGDILTVSMAVRGANPPRQPLDLTVVVDRSGSMSSEGRMSYLQRGLRKMSEQLQDGDRVDIVLFDSSVCSPLENFVVGRDDMTVLHSAIDQMRPKGSTDLDAGLREAWRIQDARQVDAGARNARVLLITDANLNAGNVNEDLVSEVGRRFEERDVRLTGIGVGRNFNDTMLNKLTEKGKGAYVYLGSEAVVDRVFGSGFDSLTRTIAHDVQFSLELPDSLAMERFYGEESSTNAADVQPIHYYAGTTQLFLQDLAIREGRVVSSDPIRLRLKYTDARTGEPAEEVLHTTVGALIEGDRHNLHKGQALMAFADVATEWAMGGEPCGTPLQAYRQRVASLGTDAEIGYTNGLVGGLCGVDMSAVVQPGVAYKVKLDSDTPIAEVGLVCDGVRVSEKLSGSDTVARFAAVQAGSCVVELQGTVPMQARVEVPETGGDVRCMVRGGRLSCG